MLDKDVPWKELVEAAGKARKNAHAPYSKFRVGAAILAGGKIFSGCNVENASYPNGICAERGAVCAMVAAGQKEAQAIALVAGPLVSPCGMCRQTLSEFAGDLPVLMKSEDEGTEELTTLEALFPRPFDL